MIKKLVIVMLVGGLSACTAMNYDHAAEAEAGLQVKTVVVDGRSYDVVFNPYQADHAVIFGTQQIVSTALPKEEIAAAGTPCLFNKDTAIIYQSSDMQHPTRKDLDNLAWIPLKCVGG